MKIVCDISVTSAPHRPRSLWSVDRLFADGADGAWYDPSDLSTLFQDADGTMPVTGDNQPVGRMLDKSGNGHHAFQTTLSSRPTYRTDGQRHWLEFDGVDDWMQFSPSLNMVSGEVVWGLAWQHSGPTVTAILSGGNIGYIGTRLQSGERRLTWNDGPVFYVDDPTFFVQDSPQAWGVRIFAADGYIDLRRFGDPATYTNSTQSSNKTTTHIANARYLMGFNPSNPVPTPADFFGAVILPEPLSEADLNHALNWMQKKVEP